MQTEIRNRRLSSRQRVAMRALLTFIIALAMFIALERNISLATAALQAIGFTIVIAVFDRFVLDPQERASKSDHA